MRLEGVVRFVNCDETLTKLFVFKFLKETNILYLHIIYLFYTFFRKVRQEKCMKQIFLGKGTNNSAGAMALTPPPTSRDCDSIGRKK